MSEIGKIILSIVVFILLAYIFYLKKEIKNITKQLVDYNDLKTRKKINIGLFDKDIENLAININNHIDIHIQSSISHKNMEDELKRAIANIAHDIRTPLTSILGYIQMSKKEELPNIKKLEYIDIAEKRAKSLKNILENFFSLSIIESPEYIIELEHVNLNSILYEVIASFYDKLNNKKINITIKEENLIILGNKTAINRVIENLITNLIKYSEGEEEIVLESCNSEVILTVSNKTKDLKKEDVSLFFNRFYKQDISRNSNKSSGLGLPIAKSLIEKMYGNMDVKLVEDKIYLICTWKKVY